MKKVLKAWLIEDDTFTVLPAPLRKAAKKRAFELEFKGKTGQNCLYFDGGEITILLGVGGTDSAADRKRAIREAIGVAFETAKKHKLNEVILGGIAKDDAAVAEEAAFDSMYRYKYGAKQKKNGITHKVVGAGKAGRDRAAVISSARAFARDLVNTPPADKLPPQIVKLISAEIKKRKLSSRVKIEIWDEKRLKRERCNGILSVGAGSVAPPRMMKLTYRPAKKGKNVVLVGKGLTFDSGGLSLKPVDGMKTMKCDMAGAAAVVGAVLAAAELRLKTGVTALLGFAENMPSGSSYRTGDIVKTRSGKTVEVLNTDAEGRIVLADLLNIGDAMKAESMIDLATLTGACLIALGEETAGLFTKESKLAANLLAAADSAGEMLWRLPMGRDFKEKMKGEISDLKNVGNRNGGSSSAAEFLAAFVEKTPWAHLDIAGPAFRESRGAGRPGGATGYGISTLVEYLESVE